MGSGESTKAQNSILWENMKNRKPDVQGGQTFSWLGGKGRIVPLAFRGERDPQFRGHRSWYMYPRI